ncbi:MAG: hypothetical protein V1656_00215 [Candidatus Jorgensenbacteria bacterium]
MNAQSTALLKTNVIDGRQSNVSFYKNEISNKMAKKKKAKKSAKKVVKKKKRR